MLIKTNTLVGVVQQTNNKFQFVSHEIIASTAYTSGYGGGPEMKITLLEQERSNGE